MRKYDELLSEYDERLYIEERDMKNDGLYADGCVWINKNMSSARKTCILAEEIGHYETSVGNIIDQRNPNNLKQENKARKWAFEKLLPEENIYIAAMNGYVTTWDIAECFELDEEFVKAALKYYGILDI